MVKVAIAGGSGAVGREVIDALLAAGKHEITVLSRNNNSATNTLSGVTWRVVDYDNQNDLVEALHGAHTLLSFIQLLSDPENRSQKSLIDAAIAAGVKRFAPSEYANASVDDMPWSAGKQVIREYLKKVNQREVILEYSLFQPSMFLDYLANPHQTAKHLKPLETQFDFNKCRVIAIQGQEHAIWTSTAVSDLAAIVALAVDYDGKWPTIGGIQGNRLTFSQIIAIGEKVRGRPFTVEKVKVDDLKAGHLKTSWIPGQDPKAGPEAAGFLSQVYTGILLGASKGAWDVNSEFNRLFPNYKFADAETFLKSAWGGKP